MRDSNLSLPQSLKIESKPSVFCPGCGHSITLKILGQLIDELEIASKTVFLIDIGCSLLAWNYLDVDTSQTHHGRTTPVAIGFKMARPDSVVVAYMGDGGGYAIGLQHTISVALRNTPITAILINNANYAMTGGQLAPTTMLGEKTTTSPLGREEAIQGKTLHGPETLKGVASDGAYIARGSVSKPLILKSYLKKALENQIHHQQFSFVEVLSLCPTNWKTDAKESLARLAKMEEEFPCKEF